MKSNINRGGRPRNIQYDQLKRIVDDYFRYEAKGEVLLLNKKGRYANFTEYARKQGIDCKSTDFSRSPQLKLYLDELTKRFSSVDSEPAVGLPVFVPLDIDYFLRPDITAEKRATLLLERDKHYEKLHICATKALSDYDNQRKVIDELRKQLDSEVEVYQENLESAQKLKHENRLLLKENRYLKRYIHDYVEPAIAKAILEKQEPNLLTEKAALLMPPKKTEQSVTSKISYLTVNTNEHLNEDETDRFIANLNKEVKISKES